MSDPRAEPARLLGPLGDRYDRLLAGVQELVNIDSGSFTAEGVNRVADWCQARFEAGGWTVQWQGQSGDIIPGNTILEGIRQVAPGAQVTFSEDASAPTAGNDVGVVVVGETPYAEGFGDVGGPLWQDNGVPRPPKDMLLSAADRTAVDRVCGTIDRCVVLVVSGRPLIVTDQLAKMDALVASWLPGSQGEGVADVLFGKQRFTGRLPQTWPRSLAQEPINVGDRDYRPLYPYGWGLRT